MADYAAIEIKQQGGKTIVMGIGRTGRGQRYIKAHEVVDVKSPSDPKYKALVAAAIAKLYAETPSP